MYCCKVVIFRYYYVKKTAFSIYISIPLILCNRVCKVFKCTEDCTRGFINCLIDIKVLK